MTLHSSALPQCGEKARKQNIFNTGLTNLRIQLGIPTANIPADDLDNHPDLKTGVYYGVVALAPIQNPTNNGNGHANGNGNGNAEPQGDAILPAVLSIGYNPFYKNTVRSVEIHVMPPTTQPSPTAASQSQPTFHRLPDFYGTKLNLLILGYIRPEFDYVSMEALIEDIRVDCEVARMSLLREGYLRYLVDDGKALKEVDGDREWLVRF